MENNIDNINKQRIENIMSLAHNVIFNLSYLVDENTVNKGLQFTDNFKTNINLIVLNQLTNKMGEK